MALGTTLVTPLEMAQAYDAFANGGNRVGAYGLERIRTAGGRRALPASGPRRRAGDRQSTAAARWTTCFAAWSPSGTGSHAAIAGYDLAGKTGTTSDFKDAWFCGFTGDLTTVVWMGRDDAAPMRGVIGGGAPAELWRTFMRSALRHLPNRAIPPGPPAPVAQPPAGLLAPQPPPGEPPATTPPN